MWRSSLWQKNKLIHSKCYTTVGYVSLPDVSLYTNFIMPQGQLDLMRIFFEDNIYSGKQYFSSFTF